MDVWGSGRKQEESVLSRHADLREIRLAYAVMRHKATIINSFFENYNRLVANLSDEYYKQDIDLDLSTLDLNEREIDRQIQYYRRGYHRHNEIIIAFLAVRTLLEKLKHITEDL